MIGPSSELATGIHELRNRGVRFARVVGERKTKLDEQDVVDMLAAPLHKPDEKLMLKGIPTSMTRCLYLDPTDRVGVLAALYFDLDGPCVGLPNPDVAANLRDLEKNGCEFAPFHSGHPIAAVDAKSAYEQLVADPAARFQIRIGGEPLTTVNLEILQHPEKLEGDFLEAARFYGTALRPRVEANELDEQNAGVELDRLLEFLKTKPEDASAAVDVCCDAGDARVGLAAWELTGFQAGPEARPARIAVMRSLLQTEQGLPKGRDKAPDPWGMEPPDDLPRTWRALEDYKLLLTWRRDNQSLTDVAQPMQALWKAALPKNGWKACRDAFVRVQQQPDATAVWPRFLKQVLTTGSLELPAPQVAPRTISEEPEQVAIGDLTISR